MRSNRACRTCGQARIFSSIPWRQMMMRFIDWLKTKFKEEEPVRSRTLRPTSKPAPSKSRNRGPRPTGARNVAFAPDLGGRVEDGGPGKNVLIRNKYVREDTGTHETLKIVDESLVETDEEFGADPYNTGRFDRSKSWDSFRKRK